MKAAHNAIFPVEYNLVGGIWTDTREIYVANVDNTYTENVSKNKIATLPVNPRKEGFAFDGWYTDSNYAEENKYSFEIPVSGEVLLYAKWIAEGESAGENDAENPGDIEDPEPKLEDKTANPHTGDGSGFIFPMILLFTSSINLAGTYVYWRKRKYDK